MTATPPTTSRARRLMATIAVAASLAVGAGTLHADVAEAAPRPARVSVSIKLTPNKGFLTGKVSSPKASCKRNRGVVLFFKESKRADFRKIRTPKSGNGGSWTQKAPGRIIPPGFYVAKVAAKPGCKPARSRVLRVS